MSSSTTAFGAAIGALGAVMVVRPALVGRLAAGDATTPPPTVVGILGARQLVQGAAVVIFPQRALLVAGSAVDLLHAASMLAAAWRWPGYRRSALVSAAVAGTSGLVGALVGRRTWNAAAPGTPPHLERRGT